MSGQSRLASWVVATHYRPSLLAGALACMIRQRHIPADWSVEIVVAVLPDDEKAIQVVGAAAMLASRYRVADVKLAPTTHQTGGGKRRDAFAASSGELVLAADDDDMQSPHRLRAAIEAHERGANLASTKVFRYLDLATGLVTRWDGSGAAGHPPVAVGTARSYRRSILERVNAWKPLPRLIEKDLQARLMARGLARGEADLSKAIANTTICVQHGSNIWDDRPAVPPGKTVRRGDYLLTGEGHWSPLEGGHGIGEFPRAAAEALKLIRPLDADVVRDPLAL